MSRLRFRFGRMAGTKQAVLRNRTACEMGYPERESARFSASKPGRIHRQSEASREKRGESTGGVSAE